ncbi:Hint domain-containing protein [Chachezhania sediminis]|uniref:Hint domain-containing protein n=1 Tax=Chachezhania sediminis TaxID=2599291 RepID=UPI00131D4572|nr:Hint domain-containing protein [Chachezhania sediminis]
MVQIVAFNPSLSIVWLAAAPDEDLTGYSILTYSHSGNHSSYDASFPINTSNPFYDPDNLSIVYYDLDQSMSLDHIRTAMAISDQNGNVVDYVGWGNDSNFNLVGGDAGGETVSTSNGTFAGDNDENWYNRAPGSSWDGNNGSTDNGLPPDLTPGFPPCFTRGTFIRTPGGERRVETLCVGDTVLTAGGAERQIIWIGSRRVRLTPGARSARLRPVAIEAGAFGPGRPYARLRVSPQHRIALESRMTDLLFGEPSALVAAKHLVNGGDVACDTACDEVEYFHFLLTSHDIVLSNGLATESYFPGPAMNVTLGSAQRAELFELFPELEHDPTAYGETCLPVLKAWEAALLRGAAERGEQPVPHDA